jgi:hypothetical protein
MPLGSKYIHILNIVKTHIPKNVRKSLNLISRITQLCYGSKESEEANVQDYTTLRHNAMFCHILLNQRTESCESLLETTQAPRTKLSFVAT